MSAPSAYPTVTPRIITDDVDGVAGFLRATFDASGELVPGRPAELRIDDSVVMVSDGGGARAPFHAFLHVYVDDADAAFARAIACGGRSLEDPIDTPYGDRRAMVADPFGNEYQIAHRLTPAGNEPS